MFAAGGYAQRIVLSGVNGTITEATSEVPLKFGSPTELIDGQANSGGVNWEPAVTASFIFMLDSTYAVDGFRLWNGNQSNRDPIRSFSLVFRDSDSNELGRVELEAAPNNEVFEPQIFDFDVTKNVRSIELVVASQLDVSDFRLREVEFLGTSQ